MVEMPQFSHLRFLFYKQQNSSSNSYCALVHFGLLSVVEHVGPQHGVVEGVHHAPLLIHIRLSHPHLTDRPSSIDSSIQRPCCCGDGQGGVGGGWRASGNTIGRNSHHAAVRRHPDRSSYNCRVN